MKTERVSLKLAKRSVSDKIELGRGIVSAMNASGQFAAAATLLSLLTTALNNLESANIAALDGGKSKKALLYQQEAVVDNLLLQVANLVEAAANAAEAAGGDGQAVITAAGMDYRKAGTPAPVPAAPQNLRAGTTLTEGSIHIEWDKVREAHVYVIEISTDASVVGDSRLAAPTIGSPNPVAVWTQVKILTQRKFSLTGLTSGTKYAIRVYCVGTHGESVYSNVVVAKAL